jgi:hypothetical protein
MPILGVPGGRIYVALFAATCVGALGLVIVLVHTIVLAATAGPPPEPAVEARFRWQDPPAIRLVGKNAPVAKTSQAHREESSSVAGTVVRWCEEDKLRRVAGILLLDNDYDGAMEMLLQVKSKAMRAFALDRAAHAKILGSLRWALLSEREGLKKFLADRRQGAIGPHATSAFERFLALEAADIHLPRCAEAIPEGLALCFMRNVHVRLARATGGSDTLLGLVLSLGFRQGSDAARVYWSKFPTKYMPYPDNLRAPAGRSRAILREDHH